MGTLWLSRAPQGDRCFEGGTMWAQSVDPVDRRKLPQSAAAPVDGPRSGHNPQKDAQLLYVKSGVLRVTAASGLYTAPPGTAVWLPPETPHEIHSAGTVVTRFLPVERRLAAELWGECRVIEVAGLLSELILQMLDAPAGYESTARGQLMTELILHELKGAAAVPLQIPMPREPRLIKLCEALIAHPESRDTLEAWARRVGASSRTVARRFRDETGLSFGVWRQHLRLGEALRRLVVGEPVCQVASLLGYRSSSAFIAMFRRTLGETPHRYLQTARD
jgi:AraC-like DNA-binding protein